MIKLISIDSSTSCSGYAIFENGILQDYGCIDMTSIKDIYERTNNMILAIYDLINNITPDIVVVEQTTVTRNALTSRWLTLLVGSVMGKCVNEGIFFYDFRPSEWRKLVDPDKKPRKREELKQWSKDTAKILFDIDNINDDVSDAILIGQAYINKWK